MPIDLNKLPRHVAIIMDGNGRWAQEHGLPRVEGHRQGAKAVREVVRAAREIGLGALTLYAFSAQNWQRPPDEVATLMQLLRDYVVEERGEIMDNDIRLVAIGEVDRLPGFVKEPLDALIRDSAENRSMTLCLALSYGGRDSIIAAARASSAPRRCSSSCRDRSISASPASPSTVIGSPIAIAAVAYGFGIWVRSQLFAVQ